MICLGVGARSEIYENMSRVRGCNFLGVLQLQKAVSQPFSGFRRPLFATSPFQGVSLPGVYSLGRITLRCFAAMAPLLLAAILVVVSATLTSLRWRRARDTRKWLLAHITLCFFAAMAQQLLAA